MFYQNFVCNICSNPKVFYRCFTPTVRADKRESTTVDFQFSGLMPKSSRARKRKIPELFFFLLLKFYNAHRITKLCYCFTAVYNISFLNSSSRSTLVHALLLTLFISIFFGIVPDRPIAFGIPAPTYMIDDTAAYIVDRGYQKHTPSPFPNWLR